MIISDIDIFRINNDRIKERSYEQIKINKDFYETSFHLEKKNNVLLKKYEKKPFLAHSKEGLDEIFNIQTMALAKRVLHLGKSKMVIGISGGSDSTLAFLVCLNVCKVLKMDPSNVIAITMPGFGTSKRTYTNSKNLIIESGATFK